MIDTFKLNIPDADIDYTPRIDTGYRGGSDTTENLRGMPESREFPDALYIEPSDWKDWARECDKFDAWAPTNRFTNQGPPPVSTHECTCHSLVQGFEAAWRATSCNPAWDVYISPLSVYCEANPRQWGGAGCLQVLDIMCRRGALPDHVGPNGSNQRERFPVTLHGTCGKGCETQTRGSWVALEDLPALWQYTARHFRPREVIIVEDIEQAISLLLRGRCVNVGRRSHAVPWKRVAWREGSQSPTDGLHLPYPDSYEVWRADSYELARTALQGASCIWSVVEPDDWEAGPWN